MTGEMSLSHSSNWVNGSAWVGVLWKKRDNPDLKPKLSLAVGGRRILSNTFWLFMTSLLLDFY
jgi:hypothetical protein